MSATATGRAIGVTGANGFVGRAVLRAIAEDGGRAVALVRDANAVGALRQPDVRAVGAIDGRTDWRAALDGCSAVVHCAARVHVMRDTAADPLDAFRTVNRDGTRRLAESCAGAGVGRLIVVSSVKVNGEATPFDPASGMGTPYTATDQPAPDDPYAISKYEAEEAAKTIADETGLEVCIIRPPLVYGPGAGGNLERLLRLVRAGLPLPFGAIRNRRSLIGIRNLADLLVHAASRDTPVGGVFLASDGEDVSTPDLVRHMARALGRPARLVPVPVAFLKAVAGLTGRGADIERLTGSLQVDSGPLVSTLGWRPPQTLEAGLRAMAGEAES
ncbi:MAG: NAD-dependent epimerase/dehydratase family protein [Pseudomonadota bacterium]